LIDELGFNPNATASKNGHTPLHSYLLHFQHKAPSDSNTKAIQQLINLKADVSIPQTESRQIPLSLARSVDVAKILLEVDETTIQQQNGFQNTILHTCVKYNHHELAHFLINQSPQLHIHLKNAEQLNALQLCCMNVQHGSIKTIKLLLLHGAPVDIVDKQGNTPLMMMIAGPTDVSSLHLKLQMIKLFLQHKIANPTIQNKKQQTVLHLLTGSKHGFDHFVEHVIEHELIDYVAQPVELNLIVDSHG
jgi:ankyrin repeat protein